MFWANPYSQSNQRHRFIYPEPDRAAKPEVTKARSYPARPRVYMIDAEDWEAVQAGLRLLSWRVKDLRAYLAQRRLGHKYNPNVDTQPRDELGRWTDTGSGDKGPADESLKDPGLITEPARLPLPAPRLPLGVPPGMNPAVHGAIESQLSRYEWLSRFNSSNGRAVFRFNAAAFEPGATSEHAAAGTGMLTRDEVKNACPRLGDVQEVTNQAAIEKPRQTFPTAQAYGTAVHTWIKDKINGDGDPDFRAEVSAIKSGETRYGAVGSKRIDVFENPNTGIICVYDIKTGERTGLSFARMRELATTAFSLYPRARGVFVTEVRPGV